MIEVSGHPEGVGGVILRSTETAQSLWCSRREFEGFVAAVRRGDFNAFVGTAAFPVITEDPAGSP